MKKLSLLLLAATFVFGSGFMKKNEDGSLNTDALKGKAKEVSEKVGAVASDTSKTLKDTAKAVVVKSEDIKAELNQSVASVKEKLSALNQDQLVAYVQKYQTMLKEKTGEIDGLKQKLKDLKWMEKFGAKGKELKAQLKEYKGQYAGLKEKYDLYVTQLKGMGVDLSAYGIK